MFNIRPALLLSTLLLSACVTTGNDSTLEDGSGAVVTTGSSASSSVSSIASWTSYSHSKGFTVDVPPGWKVDDWGDRGLSVYEPASETFAPGDGSLRISLQLELKTGDIDAFIAELDDQQNDGCGEKQPAQVGIYDGFFVPCIAVFDGAMEQNHFVQKGDSFFHFVLREYPGKDDIREKIRNSFRLK